MNGNKKIFDILNIIVIIVTIETVVYASGDLQPSKTENDYVLRSCMSSVKFSRHNANIPKLKSDFSQYSSRIRAAILPAMHYPISRYLLKSMETRNPNFGKSQRQLEQQMLRNNRPGRQMIADTPLTTLNVKRRERKNIPQLYIKHDLLPEIKSSVTDNQHNNNIKINQTTIIVIEATPRLP